MPSLTLRPSSLAALAGLLILSGAAWGQGMLPAAPAQPPLPADAAAADEDAAEAVLPPGTPVLPTTRADKRFFRLACAYDHFTVEAAQEAARATDPGLKALVKGLAADRDGICTNLLPIARAHGVVVPKGLDRQRDALLLDLKDRATGPGFDKAFASRMVKTQREILRLYERAASEDTSPDVRRFATDTLPLLRRHDADIQAASGRLGND